MNDGNLPTQVITEATVINVPTNVIPGVRPKAKPMVTSLIEGGKLTVKFGPEGCAGTIEVSADDIKTAECGTSLADEYILVGVRMDINSSYNAVREDADKSFAAACAALERILKHGRGTRAPGEGEESAFDTAVLVLAAAKSKTVEAIMGVINKWTDRPVLGTDGSQVYNEDGSPQVHTVADQRRAFTAKVKADTLTAAAYAARRAELAKPKTATADSFGDFG